MPSTPSSCPTQPPSHTCSLAPLGSVDSPTSSLSGPESLSLSAPHSKIKAPCNNLKTRHNQPLQSSVLSAPGSCPALTSSCSRCLVALGSVDSLTESLSAPESLSLSAPHSKIKNPKQLPQNTTQPSHPIFRAFRAFRGLPNPKPHAFRVGSCPALTTSCSRRLARLRGLPKIASGIATISRHKSPMQLPQYTTQPATPNFRVFRAFRGLPNPISQKAN